MGVKKKRPAYERRKTVKKKRVGRKNANRPVRLVKLLVEHEGVFAECARRLGVSPQAVEKYVRKHPEILTQAEDIRLMSLAVAGITRAKAYARISEGMDAMSSIVKLNPAPTQDNPEPVIITEFPNVKERRLNTVVALQLFGDLKEDRKIDMHAIIQLYAPQKDKLPSEVIDAPTG